MAFVKKKLFRGLALVVAGVLLVGSPVLAAIGNPDSVSIADVYVFRNVIEAGDQLYYCRYDVAYDPNPNEDPEDTWQMALYDGAVLEATRPLNYYQHSIIGIYLDSDDALVWEGAYVVRIAGMPSVFDPLIEDTNWVRKTLSAGDYYESSSLGGIMLTQAQILQDAGVGTLLTSGVLNYTGATYFLEAIPGLSTMVPEIFETTITYPTAAYTNWTVDYEEGLQAHQGARLRGAITDIGSMFGVSEGWSAFWLMGLMFLVFASVIYVPTRDPKLALLAAFPVLIGAAWLGLGTTMLQIVVIVIFGVAFLFGIYFILGRFA